MSQGLKKNSLIIASQLKLAREFLQYSREEVAEELEIDSKKIEDWEEGKEAPDIKNLETLAKLYGREIDYFLKETPPPPSRIEFRGKPGQNFKSLSKEAKIYLSRFDELCRTALELEKILNRKHEVKLPKFDNQDSPESVAKALRNEFRVDDNPLKLNELRELLEAKGTRIFILPIPKDKFSGFSFWHQEYGPCILINGSETEGRRNFTLAHELAHLLYGEGSILCYISEPSTSRNRPENKADKFAEHLLLPEAGVRKDFGERNISKRPSERELAKMATKWGTSIQALGYRLENLGLIEEGTTNNIKERKPFFRRSRIPKWEKQLGKQFVEMSLQAYQNGLISTGKLAHSLGLTMRETIEQIEKRISH